MKRPVNWQECAARFAGVIPRTRLHPAVLGWADGGGARRQWGIGFSGGADSLALLLAVWVAWPKRRGSLTALHFNHRLRGRESDGDQKFCADVCRSLGVRLVVGRWAGARRGASEAEARAARMAFFEKQAKVMWLGHQQDDIAETILMRLARGSGAGGLSAPRPVQELPRGRVHLRPLLSVSKRELADALRAAGAPWREDSSNARGDYFRNRIRGTVLPAWIEAAQRDAVAGAARSRELLAEDDTALESVLTRLAVFGPRGTLKLANLAGQPRAITRRALHRWLINEPRAGELVRQGFEALLVAVERGQPTRHSLGRGGFAVICRGCLRFEPAGPRR